VEDVAERLLCSAAKISRMETGHRSISLRDVRDLCGVYGVEDAAKREHMMTLARESRQRAWWQNYDLGNLSTYIGLETAASSISDYDSSVVLGLMQTEDYARALMQSSQSMLFNADQVEPRVEARLTRQELLTRTDPPPPRVWAVVDEAALRRIVGGPAVMHAQLQRVIEAANLPNVTLQVLPFTAGAHPALDSAFTIMEFKEPAVSSVVYVEGLVGEIYLERQADLDRYCQVFDHLRAMALGPKDSIAFIDKIGGEYRAAMT
jgi:hypothetical protein